MRALLVVLVVALAGCSSAPPPDATVDAAPSDVAARLHLVADGFSQPLLVTHAGDGSGRLFVVEQVGRVRVLDEGGTVRAAHFLDITDRVRAGGEQGLLGFAFLPGDSDVAFASYTDRGGDTVVSRFRVVGDALDPSTEEAVFALDQPYANHNGGHIAFGPDGMLYIGLGDGGSAGDPKGAGQDPHQLLGSLLRIEVGAAGTYRGPADNPYADGKDGAREVWAKGLRNPWRFSFDAESGGLFIGDVGQNAWEEIDHAPSDAAGLNYGWNVFEGKHRFRTLGDTFSAHTPPVIEYPRNEGRCAVTGGYVYRGSALPGLVGEYVFGDYCSGTIWTMTPGDWTMRVLIETDLRISSFGVDEDGELYVVHHGGSVHRLA